LILGDAVLYLMTDASKLEKGLDDAEKQTESASANMAKAFGGALVGAAAVAASAVVAVGTAAFDVASQFDAATDQIGASLGVGADEAAAYGQTIKDVYGNNFGDSIEDVGKSVESVAKTLKLAGNDPALKKMTENAFRLRDVFGTDVAESLDAVKTLMDNFGISADEAFDQLTTGYQRGLDRSGDFLDTIGEYSVQFSEGGASVNEFFSALDTGLQGGMLGTDKAADAFKEFRVRIADGSTTTATALAQIGLSADTITGGLSSGALTVKDAWDLVQRALIETQDPVTQMQAGVGLIGTQFEDLGAKVVLAMDLTDDWKEGGLSATSDLDSKYTNLGSVIEGMWRKFQVGIAPAGEAMLGFVNDNLPLIEGVVTTVSDAIVGVVNKIPEAISGIQEGWNSNWGGMRTKAEEFMTLDKDFAIFWERVRQVFTDGEATTSEDWGTWLANVFGLFTNWIRFFLDTLGIFFTNFRNTQIAFHDLMKGDWSGFWAAVGANFEGAMNVILNFVEFIFGPNLRNYFVKAMTDAWDGMKDTWNDIVEWWNGTIGALFGKTASITPDFGVVNPLNVPGGLPGTPNINDLLPHTGGTSTNVGGIVINQTFNGQADAQSVSDASENGVLRAGRNLGLR